MTKSVHMHTVHTFFGDWVVLVPGVCVFAFTPSLHHKLECAHQKKTKCARVCTPFYHHTGVKTDEKKISF